jgi:hypothetical protein
VIDRHVGEQGAIVRLTHAQLGLDRLGRQADLPTHPATTARQRQLGQLSLNGVGRSDVSNAEFLDHWRHGLAVPLGGGQPCGDL